jgi:hypothetical protein
MNRSPVALGGHDPGIPFPTHEMVISGVGVQNSEIEQFVRFRFFQFGKSNDKPLVHVCPVTGCIRTAGRWLSNGGMFGPCPRG